MGSETDNTMPQHAAPGTGEQFTDKGVAPEHIASIERTLSTCMHRALRNMRNEDIQAAIKTAAVLFDGDSMGCKEEALKGAVALGALIGGTINEYLEENPETSSILRHRLLEYIRQESSHPGLTFRSGTTDGWDSSQAALAILIEKIMHEQMGLTPTYGVINSFVASAIAGQVLNRYRQDSLEDVSLGEQA